MEAETKDKGMKKIYYLFALAYMVSYITRNSFGTVILEITNGTGMAESELALALTGAFLAYGIGQLVSGYLGDLMQPRMIVLGGLITTAIMNACIPFCSGSLQMCVVWSVNGFAQAMLWPPMVRLMATLYSGKEYTKAVETVLQAAYIGTISLYVFSPFLIHTASWKLVFRIACDCAIVMSIVWIIFCPRVKMGAKEEQGEIQTEEKKEKNIRKIFLSPMMLGVLVAIVMQGALRDSATTWMPTYVSDVFHLGSGVSILTGVILPIFSILCVRFATIVYNRKPDAPLKSAGLFFLMGMAAAVLLLLLSGKAAIGSVLCFAILTGCMQGTNYILIGILPSFFKDSGNVSAVSGVLNACTYIGSAVSTYGIALVMEQKGWDNTIIIWAGIALVGAFFCLAANKKWKK